MEIADLFSRPTIQKKNILHLPGIEPGSLRWQRGILPLDYKCNKYNMCLRFEYAIRCTSASKTP